MNPHLTPDEDLALDLERVLLDLRKIRAKFGSRHRSSLGRLDASISTLCGQLASHMFLRGKP